MTTAATATVPGIAGETGPNKPADTTKPVVPEKFKDKDGNVNLEAFSKSYTELEAKLAGKAAEKPPADEATPKPDASTEKPTDETPKPTEEAVKGFSKFEQEFKDSGKLADESYKALEEQGFDRKTVDDFIAFRGSQAASIESAVYDEFGGKEGFDTVSKWVVANRPDLAKSYNAAAEKETDPSKLKLIASGLRAAYEDANGKDSRLVGGAIGDTVSGFPSRAAAIAARNNPSFNRDPAYRAEYDRKMRASVGKFTD